MLDHVIPKVVYGIGGKRVNSMILLERMLDDSAAISDSFKERIILHVKEVMKEVYQLGKESVKEDYEKN